MTKMKTDQAIEVVRSVRKAISKEQDHDPRKLLVYYLELQKKYAERLQSPAEVRERTSERYGDEESRSD